MTIIHLRGRLIPIQRRGPLANGMCAVLSRALGSQLREAFMDRAHFVTWHIGHSGFRVLDAAVGQGGPRDNPGDGARPTLLASSVHRRPLHFTRTLPEEGGIGTG